MARGPKRARDGPDADAEAAPSSAPKRGRGVRAHAAPDAAAHPPAEDPPLIEVEDEAELQGGGERLENMAAIARRRAAHFAHFQADEGDAEQNLHTGGSEARSLGPWSSAVELIEGRAAAIAARQGRLSDAARAGIGSLKDDSISWTPSRSPKLGPRPPQTVPPLFQACLALLVEHIEDVASLLGLPDVIKIKLAAAVCKCRKLSPEVLRLFTEGSPDEIDLPDCTQLAQEDFIAAFTPELTVRLERLDLDLCGRGFSDAVAKILAQPGHTLPLKRLSLGGAYRLTDSGLTSVLKAAPDLEELGLAQCCRIQGSSLERLPELTPRLRVLDLTDCRGLSAVSLRTILCGPANLAALEGLRLDGIAEVDDALLAEICLSLPKLSRLSLNFCPLVSDTGLRGVAAGCGLRLRELQLDELATITDAGLVDLSEACPELQVLSLRRCHKVTDVGLASVASRGMLTSLKANKVHSLGSLAIKALIAACSERLEEIDFSWCRGVSDEALGLLVDSCPNLQKLTLFGCSQITNEFLHGHSSDGLVVTGATAQRSGAPESMKLKLVGEDEDEEG